MNQWRYGNGLTLLGHSFARSLARSLTHSLTHSLTIYSPVHLSVCLCNKVVGNKLTSIIYLHDKLTKKLTIDIKLRIPLSHPLSVGPSISTTWRRIPLQGLTDVQFLRKSPSSYDTVLWRTCQGTLSSASRIKTSPSPSPSTLKLSVLKASFRLCLPENTFTVETGKKRKPRSLAGLPHVSSKLLLCGCLLHAISLRAVAQTCILISTPFFCQSSEQEDLDIITCLVFNCITATMSP
jgi:hypothetical protein